MAFFWFLVSVILLIALLRRNDSSDVKPGGVDEYVRGYRDGYRAFGDEAQQLVRENVVTSSDIQSLIERNEPTVAQREVTEEISTSEPEFIEEAQSQSSIQQVEQTPEEREARSLHNLNTILYMASFLLVAAGALFVGAAMPDMVKLIGVWLIIVAFYGAGFILHLSVERLRPAASAFLGTGLALVPFGGVALGQYTALSAEVAWLITSLIGLGAYILAALRLQNQLVSYLTMAFVLSTAGSLAATMETGLVGQFVFLIVTSLLASFVATLRPRWLPSVFHQPIERTGQVVTPIVLVVSFVFGRNLTVVDYEIISTVALLHYVIAWFQSRSLIQEGAVRVLLTLVAIIFAVDFGNGDFGVTAMTLFVVASLQQAYSLYKAGRVDRIAVERQWVIVLFVVQALTLLTWQFLEHAPVFNAIGLLVLGLTSVGAALRFRNAWVGLIGLTASLLLPIVVARQLLEPELAWWSVSLVFAVLASVALRGYAKLEQRSVNVRQFMIVAYGVYLAMILITTGFDGGVLVQCLGYAAVAALLYVGAHVFRKAWLQFAGAALVLASVISLSSYVSIPVEWQLMFIGGVTAAILWFVTAVYGLARRETHMAYNFISAQFAFALIGFGLFDTSEVVSRWTVAAFVAVVAVTIFVRVWYGKRRPLFSGAAFLSCIAYFVLALIAAFGVSNEWVLSMLILGVGLFSLLSYIEKMPIIQLAASACAVAALVLLVWIIELPFAWASLFIWGGAAILHFAAAGLHAAFRQSGRQFMMTTLGLLLLFMTFMGAWSGDVVVARTTAVILLVAAVTSLALRWWNRDRSERYASLFQVSYVGFYIMSLIIAAMLGAGWCGIVLAVGAIIFWGASYAEREAGLMVIGNGLLAVAAVQFWLWAEFDMSWLVLGVGWILAVIFYFGYGVFAGLGDKLREQAMLWSTWAVLALASFTVLVTEGLTLDLALMLLAMSATLGIEAYRRKNWALGEGAIYLANVAFQRLMGSLYPELNAVFYAHWWAMVVMLIAALRHTGVRARLVIAMGLVTLSSGIYALAEGGFYQFLFLAEHLALLVIGAFRQKNWAIWWGIAASAAAILYFLREYTFLWLGFLGLLLIAIVVWRLMRGGQRL